MAPRCPRCKSKSVKHDRSLGGRGICGGCGLPLGSSYSRQSGSRQYTRNINRTNKQVRLVIFTWFIPAALISSYIYLWANPHAATAWLAPYSESTKNSWEIKTPADVELLIGKAQQKNKLTTDQAQADSIRRIVYTLISKKVRILISDNVTPSAAGLWDSSRTEIRLKPATVSMGIATLAQALAHEATHVAQSCKAGGIHKSSEPMGIEVDPAKTYQQQLDSALYKGPIANKAIELEAYSVGAVPEWAPKLLEHYCRR